jgi:uncharacterized spore protein YtfJ
MLNFIFGFSSGIGQFSSMSTSSSVGASPGFSVMIRAIAEELLRQNAGRILCRRFSG